MNISTVTAGDWYFYNTEISMLYLKNTTTSGFLGQNSALSWIEHQTDWTS